MILERVLVHIVPGQEAAYEQALVEASKVIAKADGFISIRALRGIENPHTYVLMIEWESVEAHMEGFRESELFTHYRALVGPHLDGAAQVEHYAPLSAD
jgi:heme-degrading monooxygenase HmoA